jgi:uncharacterized membrane protein YqjE
MSLNDIENAWRSPHNQPTPEEMEREKARCLHALRRRERGFYVAMAVIFSGLTFFTLAVVRHWLWPDSPRNAIRLGREWALVPLLALPWLGAISFVRQYRRRALTHPERSIAESVRALLEQARLSASRKRTMLWMHAISTPLLALAVWQIYQAGKARPNELASMAVVFVVLVGTSVGALAFDLTRSRREVARLQALAAQYE